MALVERDFASEGDRRETDSEAEEPPLPADERARAPERSQFKIGWKRGGRDLAQVVCPLQADALRQLRVLLHVFFDKGTRGRACLVAQGVPLSSVSPVVITKYFTGAVAGRWKRTTVSFYVQSLRSFFRYASSQGWCMAGIAESIDAPRLYTYENLPQGPSWGDVKKLLASVNGASPSQIRSRCAILLCAVYGLRVGEVCRLRLEDIDWAEESLCASLQTKNCEVTSPPEASIRSSYPCADICSSKLSGVASLTTKGPAFHSFCRRS